MILFLALFSACTIKSRRSSIFFTTKRLHVSCSIYTVEKTKCWFSYTTSGTFHELDFFIVDYHQQFSVFSCVLWRVFSIALCWDWQFLATFCASDKPGFSMDIIINIKISKWLINATGQWYLEHSFMTDCLVPSISLNWEYQSRFSLTDLHSQECQSLNKILKKILKKCACIKFSSKAFT